MRYLISGYYGEKNAGDEAILAGILQEIDRLDPDARYIVLSFDPDDTERQHGKGRELDAISTSLRSPGMLRTVMRGADLLISGGGSFLHEADFELHGRSFLFRQGKLRPVPYFLAIVLMARAQDLPVMWYSQGLGPLHTRTARALVARAGSSSQAVTWRDRGSARLAYEIGMRAPVQRVVPDPAYALAPAPMDQAWVELRSCGLVPGTRYLAVCPRPWLGRAGYLDSVGRALEKATAALDLEVLLVPFHEIHDPPVCETLAARPALADRAHVLPAVSDPTVLAAVLGGAELVVAMRLHSGILAANSGTPAVTIDYDPKTAAFAEQTGQRRWSVSVDDLEVSSSQIDGLQGAGTMLLFDAIADTVTHLPARRVALARAAAPLRAEAGRTAGLAVQLASGGRIRRRAYGRRSRRSLA